MTEFLFLRVTILETLGTQNNNREIDVKLSAFLAMEVVENMKSLSYFEHIYPL